MGLSSSAEPLYGSEQKFVNERPGADFSARLKKFIFLKMGLTNRKAGAIILPSIRYDKPVMKSEYFFRTGVKRVAGGVIAAVDGKGMDFRGRLERALAQVGADGFPPVIHRGAYGGTHKRVDA